MKGWLISLLWMDTRCAVLSGAEKNPLFYALLCYVLKRNIDCCLLYTRLLYTLPYPARCEAPKPLPGDVGQMHRREIYLF